MLADVNLLYTNSVQYNGEANPITATALKIVKTCEEQFEEHAEQFDALEKNLEQQAVTQRHYAETTDTADQWYALNAAMEGMDDFSYTATRPGQIDLVRKRSWTNFSFQIKTRILMRIVSGLSACHWKHSSVEMLSIWDRSCKRSKPKTLLQIKRTAK